MRSFLSFQMYQRVNTMEQCPNQIEFRQPLWQFAMLHVKCLVLHSIVSRKLEVCPNPIPMLLEHMGTPRIDEELFMAILVSTPCR
jgi:hypothetical protein